MNKVVELSKYKRVKSIRRCRAKYPYPSRLIHPDEYEDIIEQLVQASPLRRKKD